MYSWIRLQPAGLEDLVAKTGFPASRVLSVLTGLELERPDQGSSEESLCKDGFEDYRWLNI